MSHNEVVGFGQQLIKALIPPDRLRESPRRTSRARASCIRPEAASVPDSCGEQMESEWVPGMQAMLDIPTASLPALWDADFLYGPRTAEGADTYVLCEINVSSVAPYPDSAAPKVASRRAGRDPRRGEAALISSMCVAERAIEVGELDAQLVAQDDLAGADFPTRVGKAAALHLQRQQPRPHELICRVAGDCFQEQNGARHLANECRSVFGRAIDHIDLRSRLIRSPPVRLEQQIPGKHGVAVIAETGVPAVLRQISFVGKVPELLGIRPDHDAHDLIGTLLIEAVLGVVGDPLPRLLIAAGGKEPALGGIDQRPVGKIGIPFGAA